MDLIVILLSLGLLMFIAYRGFSVILFAPLCALFAVLLTEPSYVLPFFSNIFMEKMVGFVKLYFPVFLLGAIFGKIVEMSGVAKSIAQTIVSDTTFAAVSDKALHFIDAKYNKLTTAIDKQTLKLVERMQRKEAKLQSKLQGIDSTKAKELFARCSVYRNCFLKALISREDQAGSSPSHR